MLPINLMAKGLECGKYPYLGVVNRKKSNRNCKKGKIPEKDLLNQEISEEDALTNKGLQNVPDGTFKIPAVGDIVCGHYSAVSWSMAISFIGLSYRGINFNVAQPGCGFHRLIRAGNDTY